MLARVCCSDCGAKVDLLLQGGELLGAPPQIVLTQDRRGVRAGQVVWEQDDGAYSGVVGWKLECPVCEAVLVRIGEKV